MRFLENLKKIFRETDKSNEKIPAFSNTAKNDSTTVLEEQNTETRLSEYLAQERIRKQKFEEKRFQEIQIEKQAEEERAEQRRQYELETKNKLVEQKRIRGEEIERQRLEQLKIKKQRAEELDRLEKIEAEEQRKLDEIRAEEQRIYAEEKRIKAEEQRKLDEIAAKERKILEKERLKYIHSLYDDQHLEYLKEAEKFWHEFGKNVQCDICGKWDCDLSFDGGSTYCPEHKRQEYPRKDERVVKAGKHGASIDSIKK